MKSFPLSLSGNASAMLLALGMTPLLLLGEHFTSEYFTKLLCTFHGSTCSSSFWGLAQVAVLPLCGKPSPTPESCHCLTLLGIA